MTMGALTMTRGGVSWSSPIPRKTDVIQLA